MTHPWQRRVLAASVCFVVCITAMLALDLVWLGVVARDVYDQALGALKRPEPYWPAAAAFYACYVAGLVGYAVVPAVKRGDGFRRGALLGAFVYAAYDLTNWAVIRDWPGMIVPIDIGWGTLLTAVVGGLGATVHLRLLPRA